MNRAVNRAGLGPGLTRAAVLVAAASLFAATACGAGERPTEKQLSTVLQKGAKSSSGGSYTLTAKQADCAAKVFEGSDLSNEALRAIAARDTSYKAESKDRKELETLEPALRKCGTG